MRLSYFCCYVAGAIAVSLVTDGEVRAQAQSGITLSLKQVTINGGKAIEATGVITAQGCTVDASKTEVILDDGAGTKQIVTNLILTPVPNQPGKYTYKHNFGAGAVGTTWTGTAKLFVFLPPPPPPAPPPASVNGGTASSTITVQ